MNVNGFGDQATCYTTYCAGPRDDSESGPSAPISAKWHLDWGAPWAISLAFEHDWIFPPLQESGGPKTLHEGPGGPFCLAVIHTITLSLCLKRELLLSLLCVLWKPLKFKDMSVLCAFLHGERWGREGQKFWLELTPVPHAAMPVISTCLAPCGNAD